MNRPASMLLQRSRIPGYDHGVPMGVDRTQRRIIANWRSLTGGRETRDDHRPTLVALSGGADSSALAIALARARKARVVLAHIRHGLRPESLQNRDRDAAGALAKRLGLAFASRDIRIPEGINPEAGARRLRYQALAAVAMETGCRFVATAHHAEDQLETMLMALTRGAGPGGLAGIRPSRQLEGCVLLIRPTLACTRAELRAICEEASWQPVHDETNDDLSRRRAWLRATIVPELLAQSDRSLPARLDATSRLLREAQLLARDRASTIVQHATIETNQISIPIDTLAAEPSIVVGEVIRQIVHRFSGDIGRDRLGWKQRWPIIRAVQTRGMHARTFELATVSVVVSSRSLTAERH